MAGMIPRQFIDDLLARVDIVDVIDKRVPLKKAGANYKACCPFHGEKTPSFTVSSSKQFYHCFGCGMNGTAISFIMEYDRLAFPEAVEELARSLGVEVPREESEQDSTKRKQAANLYELMKSASEHYQLELRKEPKAVAYLKGRGLTGEIAKQYAIGFVPESWDFILQRLGKNTDNQTKLDSAGMLVKKDNGGYYDRFRDRIMFTIRDQRGKTIAFGGRVMGQGEPKYLNSPETPIFHKGRELYGLYEAKQHTKKLESIVVVEGYMDVVMLAQHGISNAVATLGTACTGDHIQRLFRAVNQVVFCFDGDRAGRDAAWRALNNCLPELQDGKQISFLFLPDGEDPDSMVQKEGQEAFEQRLHNAMPLSTYLIEHIKAQVDVSSIDGLSRFVELAKPLLAQIKAETFSLLLKAELAKVAGTSSEQLFGQGLQQAHSAAVTASHTQQYASTNRSNSPLSRGPAPQRQLEVTVNRRIIGALLARPSLATTISDEELDLVETLDDQSIAFIVELIDLIQANPNLNTAALLDRYRATPYENALMKLASMEFVVDDEGNESIAVEFQDAFAKLVKRSTGQLYKQLLVKPRSQLSEPELAFLKSFQG